MNKMACITGATSGFGKAVALMLAENQWDLCLCGRRAYELKEVVSLCEAHGVKVWSKVVDVRVEEEVIHFVTDMRAHFNSIEVLVNNAGLAVGKDPIQSGITEDWDRMLDTNVKRLSESCAVNADKSSINTDLNETLTRTPTRHIEQLYSRNHVMGQADN